MAENNNNQDQTPIVEVEESWRTSILSLIIKAKIPSILFFTTFLFFVYFDLKETREEFNRISSKLFSL